MTEARIDGRRWAARLVAVVCSAGFLVPIACESESQAAGAFYSGQGGPETVAIVSVLPQEATEVVRELCRGEFGAKAVQVVRKTYRTALVDVRAGRPAGHVLLGASAPDCQSLADDGWLSPSGPPAIATGLERRFHGSGDRYLVPLLRPIVIAARRGGDLAPPRKLEALVYDRAFAERLALPEPEAAPELWFGLLRHILNTGRPSDHAFDWLRTLDHQEPTYLDSIASARDALLAGTVEVALLPYDVVMDLAPSVQHSEPAEGLPAISAGVARLSASSAPAATERVYRYLCSAEFAAGMTGAKLAPMPRPDLRPGELDSVARRLVDSVWRYDYESEQAAEWIEEWHRTVRGVGARVAWWDRTLQIAMFAAFAVVLFVLYRRMGQKEKEAVLAKSQTNPNPGQPNPDRKSP